MLLKRRELNCQDTFSETATHPNYMEGHKKKLNKAITHNKNKALQH
jgi:hypothetical protein